jgi:hypothetical protein
MCATSVIFRKTAQSKQSTNGRKFAQSGHPAKKPPWELFCQNAKISFLRASDEYLMPPEIDDRKFSCSRILMDATFPEFGGWGSNTLYSSKPLEQKLL